MTECHVLLFGSCLIRDHSASLVSIHHRHGGSTTAGQSSCHARRCCAWTERRRCPQCLSCSSHIAVLPLHVHYGSHIGHQLLCVALYSLASNIASYIGSIVVVPTIVLCFATLSRDLVRLSATTYEFWFLSLLNFVGLVNGIVLVHDERSMCLFMVVCFCQYVICIDGNIYTRQYCLHLLVGAPACLCVGLSACVLRYAPRLKVSVLTLGRDIDVDTMDVMLHCYSTIGIYMAAKAIRSHHLICRSNQPARKLECDTYFPVCRLASAPRTTALTTDSQVRLDRLRGDFQSLELVERDLPTFVDADKLYLRWRWARKFRPFVSGVGYSGLILWIATFGWHVAKLSDVDDFQFALALVALVASVLFLGIHVAHMQQELFCRLLRSLDAWFISVQFSVITIGICDALRWNCRICFVLTGWVWCRWIIATDALTPVARRQLRFSQHHLQLVHHALLMHPIVLTYWIFYSTAPNLQNRVFFNVVVFDVPIRMEAYSLLVSRMWTLCLWMGRFLWREFFRPADAFKLLKFRVEYTLDVPIAPR